MIAQSTIDLLRHLAGKPGHDEVKADFRQLLIDEFGVDFSALDFERRVPEVRGCLDALIGAASVLLPDGVKFQRARGLVRAALIEAGVAQRIDTLVARLLDGA